jgi:hypothetical protein
MYFIKWQYKILVTCVLGLLLFIPLARAALPIEITVDYNGCSEKSNEMERLNCCISVYTTCTNQLDSTSESQECFIAALKCNAGKKTDKMG